MKLLDPQCCFSVDFPHFWRMEEEKMRNLPRSDENVENEKTETGGDGKKDREILKNGCESSSDNVYPLGMC